MSYTLLAVMGPGMVRLSHPTHGTQLWTAVKLRGHDKCCAMCDRKLVSGDEAFSPITNGRNRMERLCVGCLTMMTLPAARPSGRGEVLVGKTRARKTKQHG